MEALNTTLNPKKRINFNFSRFMTVETLIFLLIMAAGIALRFWDLGSRAFHHDESLHAWYSYNFAVRGDYVHNPLLHGPFQFHINALVFKLFGASDYTGRVAAATFGVLLMAMPLLIRHKLGKAGTLITVALIAFSPALLYFSRFTREDIYMMVFVFGMVIGSLRFMEERKAKWLLFTVGMLSLGFATKETAFMFCVLFAGFFGLLAVEDLLRSYFRKKSELLADYDAEGNLIQPTPPQNPNYRFIVSAVVFLGGFLLIGAALKLLGLSIIELGVVLALIFIIFALFAASIELLSTAKMARLKGRLPQFFQLLAPLKMVLVPAAFVFTATAVYAYIFDYLASDASLSVTFAIKFIANGSLIAAAIVSTILLIYMHFRSTATDNPFSYLWKSPISRMSAPAILFISFFILSIPQWGALISEVQDKIGLTLANPIGGSPIAAIGAPVGPDALNLARATVVYLLFISFIFMLGSRMLLAAGLIFYAIYIVLFTSVFTNIGGLGSGSWQSLGYWVAQQPVQRGNQPPYYYLVIVPLYEFLPLIFSLVAIVYYGARKTDTFTWFLIFWIVGIFASLSWASEKMPWLTVNMALPMTLLGGKMLGEIVEGLQWRKLSRYILPPLAAALALFIASTAVLIGWSLTKPDNVSVIWPSVLVISGIAIVGILFIAFRKFGFGNGARLFGLSLAVVFMLFSVRAGWVASFVSKDNPKDMLIYTQTSASTPNIKEHIDEVAKSTGKGPNLSITVDATDGFSWPWVWYLREYKAVGYPCLALEMGCQPLQEPTAADVILMNQRTIPSNSSQLQNYGVTKTVSLRHWFPEEVYRGWTPKSIAKDLTHARNWKKLWNFLIFRETTYTIGTVDTVVYYPKGYTPSEP
ncbi:MAG: TIGR03663 family protein [Dehalococcoidia bacterium]|nr:TIGR03663 family protein [Dehalococcoidia bacterium]